MVDFRGDRAPARDINSGPKVIATDVILDSF